MKMNAGEDNAAFGRASEASGMELANETAKELARVLRAPGNKIS